MKSRDKLFELFVVIPAVVFIAAMVFAQSCDNI